MLIEKNGHLVSITGHPALNTVLPNEPHQEHNLRKCPYCNNIWNFTFKCTTCGLERNQLNRNLCENVMKYHAIHNEEIVSYIIVKAQESKNESKKFLYLILFFSTISFLIFNGWWLLLGGLPLTIFGSIFVYFTVIK